MKLLVFVAFACRLGSVIGTTPASVEDATCAMQITVDGVSPSTKLQKPHARHGKQLREYRADDPCAGQVKMAANRLVVTNNLGGLGPTSGPPVIHVSPFVELADGRTVDITIANLTAYSSNTPNINGLNGEFTNVNMAAGFVDLLLTFTDTETGGVVTMPPFNLTIYDLDGQRSDVYAETVCIDTYDMTGYKLTDTTDVTVTFSEDRTEFGSSAIGELCDNPASIETLGVVFCNTSGTVDQAARSVAVQLKGGIPNYHITLRASDVVRKGRNFLFGAPAYFNQVCKVPESPTASPTYAPTLPPTASPTGGPTGGPTGKPTTSPTASPTEPPTSPPTGGPTSSPTASPTTASPTSVPTFAPTGTPTAKPTDAPTTAPTASPTAAPTSGPATSFGDPHITNVEGQTFEIRLADYHNFLLIPRSADPENALLHVTAKVEPHGSACSGRLFVTGLTFDGRWLGEVGSLEFSTDVNGGMDAQEAVRMRVGSFPDLNVAQFRAMVPAKLAEVAEFQPEKPHSRNGHVTLLEVKLSLGPATSKVRMVYQKEKVGASTSLWLTTTGLHRVDEAIGGILGLDAHDYATQRPKGCLRHDIFGSSNLLQEPRGSIHAQASFNDEDES